MEQLRVALEVLKKYHFWMLVGLIVLITFGTWYFATATRAKAFDDRKKTIDSTFSATKTLSSTEQPSETYNKALDLRIAFDANASEEVKKLAMITSASQTLASNVAVAAARLFEDQRTGFQLPAIYNNAKDQADFEKAFWKVWNHKIEDIAKPPADAPDPRQYELGSDLCLRYRDHIKGIFPKLFEMIELRGRDDQPGAAAKPVPMPGEETAAGDDADKPPAIVDWAGANHLMTYFDSWTDTPKTIDVIVAQENFWVYEALLKVIRNTNDVGPDTKHDAKNYKPPDSHKNANIKEIKALEIGKDAADSWAASENKVIALEGGATGGSSAAAPPAPGGHYSSATAGGFVASGGSDSVALLNNRYVDNGGKLLADGTQQPNQEFRMMPVNLRVIIEQKAIPRLLAECANSNMRIDVRAVRILAEEPAPFEPNSTAAPAATADAATAHPQAPVGYPAYPGPGRRPLGPALPQATGDQSGAEEDSADAKALPVPVEIQGIIYIYNPPTATSTNGEGAATTGGTSAAPVAPAPAGAPAPATPPLASGATGAGP